MLRTTLLVGALALTAGCTTTPLVTKQNMTLGEANISGMECRRHKPADSLVVKSMCAEPQLWASWDKREAEKSEIFLDQARDNNDNRLLYRNR